MWPGGAEIYRQALDQIPVLIRVCQIWGGALSLCPPTMTRSYHRYRVWKTIQVNLLEICDWWQEMVGQHPPSLLDV